MILRLKCDYYPGGLLMEMHCEIRSHDGDSEDYCLVGCGAV
jgi:hypothetical protein